MPASKKTILQQYPRVTQYLPSGETLHEPKGPIIWLSKKHLKKIEDRLQSFEDIQEKIKSVIKIVNDL